MAISGEILAGIYTISAETGAVRAGMSVIGAESSEIVLKTGIFVVKRLSGTRQLGDEICFFVGNLDNLSS